MNNSKQQAREQILTLAKQWNAALTPDMFAGRVRLILEDGSKLAFNHAFYIRLYN